MADEIEISLMAEADTALTTADLLEPLVEEPASATTIVVVEAPAEQIEEPVSAPAAKHHSETPTLMGDAKFKGAPDPLATKTDPQGEPVKTDPVAETAAIAAIVYDFKVPDDIRMTDADRERVTATFHGLGFDQAKADTALDAYYAEVRRMQAALLESEHTRHNDAFLGMRKSWLARIKSDPVFKNDTALNAAIAARDRLVPNDDAADYNELVGLTGAGDHPGLVRIFYRAHEAFDAYEARIRELEGKLKEGRPPPPNAQVPNGARDPRRGMSSIYETVVTGQTPR